MEVNEINSSIPVKESIYKLEEYTTNTGKTHYFEDYFYYVDRKKLYKITNQKVREIPMKNSYFIIKNKEGKQCCVSWLKLDLQYLLFQATSRHSET